MSAPGPGWAKHVGVGRMHPTPRNGIVCPVSHELSALRYLCSFLLLRARLIGVELSKLVTVRFCVGRGTK
ncbi:hypothetical protein HBI56_019970 [Parastagonospora nodorum]|nr:hypothetical protein HBH53_002790 [Parastagonospora nodorum]KAH4007509.1 hypothetical protein HBI10_006950 [Parastagonospora nodorum]KAH4023461.1 hypothetical protein HBI13_088660 [Parastagonospora nodorum]KAH4058286.1 hypothetical protein HBH49_031130 [Parastagonospora nodorum]KAH4133386.1 hypothetical protein HBH47_006740 [Parastagonospora nodorum]